MKRNKTSKSILLFIGILVSLGGFLGYRLLQKNEIEITSNAINADVIIDKSFYGKTPLTLHLKPGVYDIQISKQGFVKKRASVPISEETKQIRLNLLKGFRYIPAGRYMFGNTWKQLKGFYLSETEVTNELYLEFLQETGNNQPYFYDDERFNSPELPVIGTSYEDAILFTKWYSEKTGYRCRLPYEYEWEYAANGRKGEYVFPWGNTEKISGMYMANYHPFDFKLRKLLPINIDGFQYLAPPRSFPAGNNGLFDMGGNAFEWVLDTLTRTSDYPDLNLKKTPTEFIRIVKGGSWNFNQRLMEISSHVFVDGRIRRGNNGIRLLIEKEN